MKYKVELTPRNDATYDRSQTWVDPFVGGEASGKLGDAITVAARADIGGFALGSDVSILKI